MTAYATEISVERLADKVQMQGDATGEAIGALDKRVDLLVEQNKSMLVLLQSMSQRQTELLDEQATLRQSLRDVEIERVTVEHTDRARVVDLEIELRRGLRELSRGFVVVFVVIVLLALFELVIVARRASAADVAARWSQGAPPEDPSAARTWWAEGLARCPQSVVVVGGDGGLSGCVDDDDDPQTTSYRAVVYAQGSWQRVVVDDVLIAWRGLYLPMMGVASDD